MTLYPFNTGIPATNNNPSDDQPDMKINNVSTSGILGVNHTTFNVNNGGQHTAIQFNQDASYAPGSYPVSPPELFTNTVSGLPQLFYYSGTEEQSANQYVNASAGSTFLFGGIILKWGSVTGVASGGTVTFASAFPNNCYTVVLNSALPSTNRYAVPTSFSTTGFVMQTAGGISTTINYVAIGN